MQRRRNPLGGTDIGDVDLPLSFECLSQNTAHKFFFFFLNHSTTVIFKSEDIVKYSIFRYEYNFFSPRFWRADFKTSQPMIICYIKPRDMGEMVILRKMRKKENI